jgi:hypothetical protein
MPTGPLQFDMQVFDTYQTNDPAAPIDGAHIVATISITINWNVAGTELTNAGVVFSAPVWIGPGGGPLNVYDNTMGGGLKLIGTVTWSVNADTLKRIDTDTANQRLRWMITPVLQLIRTFKPNDGSPPDIEVAYTNSDTSYGNWTPMPQPTTAAPSP